MKFPNPIRWLRRCFNLPDTPELQWLETATHKRRLEQVKTVWILVGLLLLAIDHNAAVFLIGGFCLCLSFAYLEGHPNEES